MISIVIPIKDDYESLEIVLKEISELSIDFIKQTSTDKASKEPDFAITNKSIAVEAHIVEDLAEDKSQLKFPIPKTKLESYFFLNQNNSSNLVEVVVIDDGSEKPFPNFNFENINIVVYKQDWSRGHQESIVQGLSLCNQRQFGKYVVVMDGDGEDRVEDIFKLSDVLEKNPDTFVVCAKRGKRNASKVFKSGYFFYKLFFRLLTGKNLEFGNFMGIRASYLETILSFPNLSTNVAASIMRYAKSIELVKINRGARLFGQSKMNFTRLILHGYSAIAVFADVALIRMILFSSVLLALFTIFALAILFFKVFGLVQTIPGWTSIVLLQLLSIFSIPFYVILFISLVFINLRWSTDRIDSR